MTDFEKGNTLPRWSIIGAFGSAIAATACCLGPLILVSLGVGGAWVSQLALLERFSPLFMLIAIVSIGTGFYRVYFKKKEACEEGSVCANPRTPKVTKMALWLSSALVALILAGPHLAPVVLANGKNQQNMSVADSQAVFKLEGMTCAACTVTVQKSLTQLEGVAEAEVTLKPPQAIVKYDGKKVTPEEIMEATRDAGYPSSLESSNHE